ncbi:fumarylacetoacetate hydrolase family protein [Streptomyces sp. ZAF1911]|uniref:fumarylacetoacetate hydrolase family protein n=1 Tax=Streptomyces sp. ZAF1911 TaxID=2944129 RepID=UPI00237A34CB|nr:fumarylacetoacetate hydrolase family protein [Streptomyces sp. ZAF1911]MDD9376913.1 fumarylacetoacetate hydrolase family protein [Streptomyces sp. ZAF1911]
MRLATVRLTRDRTAAARIDKKALVLLPHPDVGALIASGNDWAERAASAQGVERLMPGAAAIEALLTPRRILRVGPNYPMRMRELDQEPPSLPTIHATRAHLVAGDQAIVPLPLPAGPLVGWGAELGVVISRRARDVPVATALRHVAGFTVTSHIHAPQQKPDSPVAGATLIIGPALVTPDELPLGGRGLTITSILGGRMVQKASTSELHFDVATVIARASAITELHPGDLVSTGTPGGTREVPLEPGQQLYTAIKGIGEITTYLTPAAQA